MPVDKWDDMEIELSSDPKNPPSPTWDERQIDALMKPGRKPDDPRSRTERRRQAVRRKP